jgi:hypothetical protein
MRYVLGNRIALQAFRPAFPSIATVLDDAEWRFVEKLTGDIDSGAWDERYGFLRKQSHFQGSLRLIVGERLP